MIVLDASVLTEIVLAREPTLETADALLAGDAHGAFHAPELIEIETLNALRGVRRRRLADEERVEQAVTDLDDVRVVLYPHGPLRDRVWALRDRLSAYDAAYVALAGALDAKLLTSDRRLARGAVSILGAAKVRTPE